MPTEEQARLIRTYIDAWLERDLERLLSAVSDDVRVTECDGRVIAGRRACRTWFERWHRPPANGRVEAWDVHRIHCHREADAATAEWSFRCMCYGNTSSFDGASVFEFERGRIRSIHETRMAPPPHATGKDPR